MFNLFPYTNFHELNADWLVKATREAVEEAKAAKVKAEEIQKFVTDYLETHAVDESVRKILDDWKADGTLDNIVAQYIGGLGPAYKILFIGFPGLRQGLCAAVRYEASGNVYVIDFGAPNSGVVEYLIQGLTALGYTKIKGIIITHYHDDHIGGDNAEGLATFLAAPGLDFSKCEACLPKIPDFTQWIGDYSYITRRDATVQQLLTAKGIPFGNAPTTFTEAYGAVDVYAEFTSDLYRYTLLENLVDSGATNYNNFSSIIRITSLSGNTFISSDIEPPAQKNYVEQAMNTDIYQVEHHGLNFTTDPNYLAALHPSHAVVPAYGANAENIIKNNPHPTAQYLAANGADLRYTFLNGYIAYTVGNSQIQVEAFQLTPTSQAWANPSPLLGPSDTIPDGTDVNSLQPGTYSAQNATHAGTLQNGPTTTSGFKLIRDVTTNGGARTDMAFAANTVRPTLFMRNQGADDAQPGAWKGLVANWLWTKILTNEDFPGNYVTLYSGGGNVNRAVLANGMITIQARFDVKTLIPARARFISVNIPDFTFTGSYNYGYLIYLTGDTTAAVPIAMEPDQGKLTVFAYKDIPAGRVCGLSLTSDMFYMRQ